MDEYQSYPDYGSQTANIYGEPPKRNTSRIVMIVVGVLLLLCCCCIAFSLIFYFWLGDIITDELGITQQLLPFLPT